jgi:hypothetical protein
VDCHADRLRYDMAQVRQRQAEITNGLRRIAPTVQPGE